jgi:hypothetical protein
MWPDGEDLNETVISLHMCAMIEIAFFDTISDFSKFIPPKELVHLIMQN